MKYSKYEAYKSKGMISIDNSKTISVYTLSTYNSDTGALEPTETAEIDKTTIATLKLNLETEKAKIQAEIDGLDALEKDIN